MRYRALPFVLAMSLSVGAQAQVISQPTPAPLVTADNASWFVAGEPLEWNGGFYYPAGAQQRFNPSQMVPNGSFRGIPLYTNTVLQPDGSVFVPLSGGLVKPYQRRHTEGTLRTTGGVPEALSPPTGAFTYDPFAAPAAPAAFAVPAPVAVASLRSMSEPMAVGTRGRVAAVPALGAEAMAKAAPRPVFTLTTPTGVNGIWVNYEGRRWFLAGKAIDYDAATLAEVGTYHGWSVYLRNGDRSTIYIPTTPGRLAPYKAR